MINLIWAMDENWLIGQDNQLPWHIPADLQYFKQHTHNKNVIMGELTYQSLKAYYKTKPLPFNHIFVANLDQKAYDDATWIPDVVQFLKETKDDLYVIGGKTIYQLSLPYANRLYITYILNRYKGNVYFPTFDLSQFEVIDKRLEPGLIFTVYERRKSL